METEIIKHPAYGLIRFSRVNGHKIFYGSELEQDNYIELEVKGSVLERTLDNERFGEDYKNNIVRLRMTAGQFSELITSMNISSGVPCTLEYVKGEKVKDLNKIESRKEFIHSKFKERMKEFSDTIKLRQLETIEIVKKKTLSKTDIDKLTHNLEYLTTEISSNIPFFLKCFQEDMDKVVFEAKLEVENAILHKIQSVGFNVLQEQHKQLENGTKVS